MPSSLGVGQLAIGSPTTDDVKPPSVKSVSLFGASHAPERAQSPIVEEDQLDEDYIVPDDDEAMVDDSASKAKKCAVCDKSPGLEIVFAPVMTKCLHNICIECYQNAVARNPATSSLVCQFCDVSSDLSAPLPVVALPTSVDVHSVAAADRCQYSGCEDASARAMFEVAAAGCDEKFKGKKLCLACVKVYDQHFRGANPEATQLADMSSSQIRQCEMQTETCSKHYHSQRRSVFKRFCVTCDRLICSMCMTQKGVDGHDEHVTILIYPRNEKLREVIDAKLTPARAHRDGTTETGSSATISGEEAREALARLRNEKEAMNQKIEQLNNTISAQVRATFSSIQAVVDDEFAKKKAELYECSTRGAGLEQVEERYRQLNIGDSAEHMMCVVGPAIADRLDQLLKQQTLPAKTLLNGLSDVHIHESNCAKIVASLAAWTASGPNADRPTGDDVKMPVVAVIVTPSAPNGSAAPTSTLSSTKRQASAMSNGHANGVKKARTGSFTKTTPRASPVPSKTSTPALPKSLTPVPVAASKTSTPRLTPVRSSDDDEDDGVACVFCGDPSFDKCGVCELPYHRQCHAPAASNKAQGKKLKCTICANGVFSGNYLLSPSDVPQPAHRLPLTVLHVVLCRVRMASAHKRELLNVVLAGEEVGILKGKMLGLVSPADKQTAKQVFQAAEVAYGNKEKLLALCQPNN